MIINKLFLYKLISILLYNALIEDNIATIRLIMKYNMIIKIE